jgi:hypothetical protein
VALRFHLGIVIQRAGSNEDHPWSLFRTQVYAATAGSAEKTMFPRRRLVFDETVFAESDFEAF